MRIGQFGKVNGISLDTIRHYLDLGLIVPEKPVGHYFFDENCQSDLELILDFKGMPLRNSIKSISISMLFARNGKNTIINLKLGGLF